MRHLGDLEYGTLFNHSQLQPVVHRRSRRPARARALPRLHAGGRPEKRAQWGDAIYENDYVKENGVWKIQHLHSYFIYYVHATQAGTRAAIRLPARFPDLPPDEPVDGTYKLYPDDYIPPYHYKNPVTGK